MGGPLRTPHYAARASFASFASFASRASFAFFRSSELSPPPSETPPGDTTVTVLPIKVAPQQLKKVLVASGFEVFRTLAEEVVLAERVRENLILDSGVRIGQLSNGCFRVRVVLRGQRSDFPSDEESALFERVRVLGADAVAHGFAEVSANVNCVKDPADPERTLDTFYELSFAREVATVEDALPVLRFALLLEKDVLQSTPAT